MATQRHIDTDKRALQLEFTDGATYGPIDLNPTTDALTKMIAMLDARVAVLEEKALAQGWRN
jgi:hypothetical protein